MRHSRRILWFILIIFLVWIGSAASGVASYPRPLSLLVVAPSFILEKSFSPQISPSLAAFLNSAISYTSSSNLTQENFTPTPTYDPLAIPVMPENPTQLDIGRLLYYHNCMPCHGDRGQGLTDEFRMVWVEDHRNCWGRGCHGGRQMDEGFPIPTIVPAVIAEIDALPGYADPESLLSYLRLTHPPQNPGCLQEDEYRALGALLWVSNGKPGSLEAFATLPASYSTASVATPHIALKNPASATPMAPTTEATSVTTTPTLAPASTAAAEQFSPTPVSSLETNSSPAKVWMGGLALVGLLLVAGILAWVQRTRLGRDKKPG